MKNIHKVKIMHEPYIQMLEQAITTVWPDGESNISNSWFVLK